jgi:hypothetical protein
MQKIESNNTTTTPVKDVEERSNDFAKKSKNVLVGH